MDSSEERIGEQGLNTEDHSETAVWTRSVADLLGGLECVLESTRVDVLALAKKYEGKLLATRSLIETTTNLVCLLEKRRLPLIFAAVNGKIDVRGWLSDTEAEEPELAVVAEGLAVYPAQGGAA